jgi:hypothetical protein
LNRDFALPGHESVLPDGQQITIARTQVDRLLELNDAGTRLRSRFAGGPHCAAHADDCVDFENRSTS